MLIDSIVTRDGQSIDLKELNVILGPNNTGKTQTLQDILAVLGVTSAESTIISGLEYDIPDSLDEWTSEIDTSITSSGVPELNGLPSQLTGTPSQQRLPQNWERRAINEFESGNYQWIINAISSVKSFYLDAESRLSASSKSRHQDVGDTPNSLIQMVYNEQSDTKVELLRDAFNYVFDKDIAIEYSGQNLQFYISNEFNDLPDAPIDRHSVLAESDPLDEQGGGFRSFAGVILSLLVSEDRVVLIDEPRAFLHPAQSRKMGNWIAQNIDDLPGQIVLATHDANFIAGLLIGGQDIAMYRLSRAGENTVYHQISTELTRDLATDPILSSQSVLDSLFHRGVVVCEGDEDRSVYRSVIVNEFGRDDYLFIHTYGKGKMDDVTGALTESNVPAAAVLDIDVLKNSGEWRRILQSTGMNDNLVDGFVEMGEEINESVRDDTGGWEDVQNRGVEAIPVQGTFEELAQGVREYGIFIVPVGELESWMDLSLGQNTWIITALEEINNNNYGDQGLHQFCARIDHFLDEKYEELSGNTVI